MAVAKAVEAERKERDAAWRAFSEMRKLIATEKYGDALRNKVLAIDAAIAGEREK
jgi:hypothetical protein